MGIHLMWNYYKSWTIKSAETPSLKKAQLCSPWVPTSQPWDLFFQQTFSMLISGIQQSHDNQESLRIKWQHRKLIQLC